MSIAISVVIPTYKRTQLLVRCLKALLQQRFEKDRYEIIVVSDGPDDETQRIFNVFAGYEYPALRYLPLSAKKGPAAARNYGWLNAKGSIIAFTDDDCVPDIHWLDQLYQHLKDQEYAAITGKVIVPVNKRPTDFEKNTAGLQFADFITANCACTKAALVKTGGFDEDFSMAWREDSDLEFKLIANNIPVTRVNTAIVTHPVRHAAWGVSIREQKKTMFNALLYKKYPRLYRKKIQPAPPVLYYGIITAVLVMLAGVLLTDTLMALAGAAMWLVLTLYFIYKRLQTTSLALAHVAEMIVTSLVIPFASIYWQWYGAVKYRVLFI